MFFVGIGWWWCLHITNKSRNLGHMDIVHGSKICCCNGNNPTNIKHASPQLQMKSSEAFSTPTNSYKPNRRFESWILSLFEPEIAGYIGLQASTWHVSNGSKQPTASQLCLFVRTFTGSVRSQWGSTWFSPLKTSVSRCGDHLGICSFTGKHYVAVRLPRKIEDFRGLHDTQENGVLTHDIVEMESSISGPPRVNGLPAKMTAWWFTVESPRQT